MSIAEVATSNGVLVLDDAPLAEEASRIDLGAPLPRLAYAATHVAFEATYANTPHTIDSPGTPSELAAAIDWQTTMAIRETIGATGIGIAEAMDTAQRFSLGWDAAKELIRRTGKLNLSGGFCAGAGTDHLTGKLSSQELITGVSEQIHFIVEQGGTPIILPMETLSTSNAEADEYVRVYEAIAKEAPQGCPLFIHWLGPMFLKTLKGYFPGDSFLRIMQSNPDSFRGAKLSLLDADLEMRLRSDLLLNDQIMLTGDDFHFGELIAGNNKPIRTTCINGRDVQLGNFSHALLGIFDAIAQPAAIAIRALGEGDEATFSRIIKPCETLGQTIFQEPTRFYKTGLAFLSWLNGAQPNAMLANHEEHQRAQDHLLDVVRCANAAGAISNAPVAAERLREWLEG